MDGPHHDQTIAAATASLYRWKRLMFSHSFMTPDVRQTNEASASGSIQNSVLPAPLLPNVPTLVSVPYWLGTTCSPLSEKPRPM